MGHSGLLAYAESIVFEKRHGRPQRKSLCHETSCETGYSTEERIDKRRGIDTNECFLFTGGLRTISHLFDKIFTWFCAFQVFIYSFA